MSYALGQPVPLQALVYDSAGAAANATTVTLTITRPDGATDTPTVDNPPATTGTYEYDYDPTNPGLYGVRWVFTGVNTSAPPVDSFYVDQAVFPPLCSLAEAREQCRITDTADDVLLQRYLRVASNLCERRTQVWRRQTLTVTKDGGLPFIRLRRPVISITEVFESGVLVDASGYTFNRETGLLYRGDSTSCGMRWEWGRANIAVTYVAGASDGIVPEEIRQGVLLLTQHLWNTQRGGSNLPRSSDGGDFTLPAGFTIPNAVREEWADWLPVLVG